MVSCIRGTRRNQQGLALITAVLVVAIVGHFSSSSVQAEKPAG